MNEWKPTENNIPSPWDVKITDYNIEQVPFVPISSENTFYINQPKYSNYKCYLFGNRPGGTGIVYTPQEGRVPNRFVRFFMYLCFDCLWVEEKK